MTLGNVVGLMNAADRILNNLRRDNPEKLLARLAEIADDEPALNRLHQDLEQLTRKLAASRQVPVVMMGADNGALGRKGLEQVRQVRDDAAGPTVERRSLYPDGLVREAEGGSGGGDGGVAENPE
jgi:hypothetical protein